MSRKSKTKREFIRIGKHLNEMVTINDHEGNLIQKILKPVMLEVYPRDVMQLIVGATLLAIPLAFTEEVWYLGQHLPWSNIAMLGVLSLVFTSLFIYYNFYKNHFLDHWGEFLKRIVLLYIITLAVSWLVLFAIDQAPTGPDYLITIKRMVILSFPASMSAAVADMIK